MTRTSLFIRYVVTGRETRMWKSRREDIESEDPSSSQAAVGCLATFTVDEFLARFSIPRVVFAFICPTRRTSLSLLFLTDVYQHK